MTRAALDYTAPAEAKAFVGFDPDTPEQGHYRMRLRSGGVMVGVKIWFGPPHDPDTGEEMDRAPRWQATVNNAAIDLDRVWPKCAADAIPVEEHDYLARRQAWAREHAPDSPQADPTKRIDPLTAPTPF